MSAARTIPSPGRRLAAAILIVFLLSLAVHAVALSQYRSDPFFETHVADALSYHEWALRIVFNGLAAEPVFHQSPLFPVLLAATYGATAEEHWPVAALLLQMLLGSAAIVLLVPLGRSLFGSTAAGLCAAGLVLLHGPFVFYGLKLLPVPLALATQCAALLALTVARNRGGAGLGILAGLHMALACLARSEMLLFLPFAVLALLFPAEPSGRERRRLQALLFLVAFAAFVAPVTLHNLRQGDLVLIASSAGENLYIGNQSKGSGGYTALHPQAGDLFSQRALAEKIAEEQRGEELKPSEISSYWRDRALRGIRDDPGGWLRLELRKLGRLLHPGDPTDIYSFALERKLYLTSLYALPLTPWLLLLLGVVGAVVAIRANARTVWPLGALIAVHLLVLLLFFVDSRLRMPLLFFCAAFGGHALAAGWRAWRSRPWNPWVLGIAALCAVAVAVGVVATGSTPRDRLRIASVLSMQERLDDSLELLRPLLSGEAPDPYALDQAGWVLQKKGDLEAARDHYVRALEGEMAANRACQTGTRLAIVHERLGEIELAAARHDLTVANASANTWNYYERAMFRSRRGDREGAIEDLRESVRLAPAWSPPRTALRELGVTD